MHRSRIGTLCLPKGLRGAPTSSGRLGVSPPSSLSSQGDQGGCVVEPAGQQAEPAREPSQGQSPKGDHKGRASDFEAKVLRSLDDLISEGCHGSIDPGRSEASGNAVTRRRAREHGGVDAGEQRKKFSRSIGRMPVSKDDRLVKPGNPQFMYRRLRIGVWPWERAMHHDLERMNGKFRLLSGLNPEHDLGILTWEAYCETHDVRQQHVKLGQPREDVFQSRELRQCLRARVKLNVRNNTVQMQVLQEVLSEVDKKDQKKSQTEHGPQAMEGVQCDRGEVVPPDYRLCTREQRFKFWQDVTRNPYPCFPPLHVVYMVKDCLDKTTTSYCQGKARKACHFPRENLMATRTASMEELWKDIVDWEPHVRSAHITYHMSSPNSGDGSMLMGPHDPLRRAHAIVHHYWKGDLVESAGPWTYPIATHGLNAWGVKEVLKWGTFGTTTAVLVELDQWVGPFKYHWLPQTCLLPYMRWELAQTFVLPDVPPVFQGTVAQADQFIGLEHSIQAYFDAASAIKCWPHQTGSELLGAYANADAKHPLSKDVVSLFQPGVSKCSGLRMGNSPAPLYQEYRRKGSLLDLEVHAEWQPRQLSAMYLPAVAGMR